MNTCALCGTQVDAGRDMSRRETCRSCGGDLHICLNCRFYSDTAHNKCIETRAEHQRDRDKANFCDYFQWGAGSPGGDKGDADAKAQAMRKLDDLFK
jgi:hypothetical protein